MTSSAPDTPATPAKGGQLPIPFVEFVALIAGAMALTALSIDLMLPALPQIADSLHITNPNDRQLIISTFTLAIGLGALVYGPLSDRFGRKPVLCSSIGLFICASLLCTFAPTFEVMLAARFAAGLFIASNRVVTVSIVRDGFSGDAMARVMSLIFILFMIVPIIAPSLGQLLLMVAPWRAIFGLLTAFAGLLLLWTVLRLPETLKPEHRIGIRVPELAATFRLVMTHRSSLGHTLAGGVIGASITAFIVSIQQIVFDIFHAGDHFALLFAGIAGWMALGSYLNSRFVRRFGARRMSLDLCHRPCGQHVLHGDDRFQPQCGGDGTVCARRRFCFLVAGVHHPDAFGAARRIRRRAVQRQHAALDPGLSRFRAGRAGADPVGGARSAVCRSADRGCISKGGVQRTPPFHDR